MRLPWNGLAETAQAQLDNVATFCGASLPDGSERSAGLCASTLWTPAHQAAQTAWTMHQRTLLAPPYQDAAQTGTDYLALAAVRLYTEDTHIEHLVGAVQPSSG
jgi:hypothetical protein